MIYIRSPKRLAHFDLRSCSVERFQKYFLMEKLNIFFRNAKHTHIVKMYPNIFIQYYVPIRKKKLFPFVTMRARAAATDANIWCTKFNRSFIYKKNIYQGKTEFLFKICFS